HRQGPTRPRQGQAQDRQARHREGARLAARQGAPPARKAIALPAAGNGTPDLQGRVRAPRSDEPALPSIGVRAAVTAITQCAVRTFFPGLGDRNRLFGRRKTPTAEIRTMAIPTTSVLVPPQLSCDSKAAAVAILKTSRVLDGNTKAMLKPGLVAGIL